MQIMSHVVSICSGFFLDLVLGDPYSFPHPVRFIGKYIEFLESKLRKACNEKFAGICLTFIVVFTSYFVALYLSSISLILEIILIYTVFSTRTLADEARRIYELLERGDIPSARRQVGLLVSRDTDKMQEKDIVRATVETVSENIVDGIISPMFYLFIGGASLGMGYKAASTLDSMVGYKNEKYINFGWASARLDDLLNFIPARITSFLLIPFAAFLCGMDARNSFRVMLRDRHKHSSPNSAHSEAAVAGALGCRLGGPVSYFGKTTDKPYIGDALKETGKEDIQKSIRIMYATAAAGLVFGCGLLILVSVLF